MRNYFKKIFEKKDKSFVFTTKHLGEDTSNGTRITTRANQHRDMVSIDDLITWQQSDSSTNTISTYGTQGNEAKSVKGKVDERKEVQPKEVFAEIKKETPDISFERLPEKIKAVEERLSVLKEHLQDNHLNDEHRTLFFLRNRLKYLETKKKNPLDWGMTTEDAIQDLCKRYKLKVVALKQYYTLVPAAGIKEMDRYSKAYKAITGDTPIFELVIKDIPKDPATKKKDRDPILLANSPLGNFLFVLGAWDDEVEVVDEIIYYGK